MRKFLTPLLLAAAALGLTYGAGIPRAQAAPDNPDSESSGWSRVKPSPNQWLVFRLSAAAADHNHSPARILDYRNAIKYFKTASSDNVSYRRGFAAGWLHSGGEVHHISAAELKKVKAVKKGAQPNAIATPMDGCTGKSGVKTITAGKEWREWYNSCQTTTLTSQLGWVPWSSGVAVAFLATMAALPGYEYIAAGVAAIALTDADKISSAQAHSKYHAIVVTTEDVGGNPTNGTRYINYIIEPQNGQYG